MSIDASAGELAVIRGGSRVWRCGGDGRIQAHIDHYTVFDTAALVIALVPGDANDEKRYLVMAGRMGRLWYVSCYSLERFPRWSDGAPTMAQE